MTERLSRHLAPPSLGEARVSRQWSEIDARSAPAPRWQARVAVTAGMLGVAAACVLFLRAHRGAGRDAIEGSMIESGTVTLSDGSPDSQADFDRAGVRRDALVWINHRHSGRYGRDCRLHD